jgi:DNA (cytosine-5)-methyltransferase 1
VHSARSSRPRRRPSRRSRPLSCPRCTADQAILRTKERPEFPDADASFRLFDLFAGCGALSIGFLLAGLETGVELGAGLAVELEETPALTYKNNIGGVVKKTNIEALIDGKLGAKMTAAERKLKNEIGELQLGLAGPPCQGHSDLNNHTRRSDPRNELYARVARAAAVLEPQMLSVENVPAIRNDHAGVLDTTRDELERLGYSVAAEIIDTQLVGIPQRRRRHIMLACAPGSADPEAVLEKLLEHPCSDHLPRDVRWGIDDLKATNSDDSYDTASVPSEENRQRIDYLFDHKRYNLPNPRRPTCHRDVEHTYNAMYGRLRWDAPAQTITSGYGSMGQGRYVHPGRRRTLTPHEAARLQTIPDWFAFEQTSTRTRIARMIGNAVPPFLGLALGRLLLPALSSTETGEATPRISADGRLPTAA